MFPERLETDRLDLVGFPDNRIDAHSLYGLFGVREDVEDVFEYVPQEPYRTIKDARDRVERGEDRWADGEAAWYGVVAPDEGVAGYAILSLEWNRRTGSLGVVLAEPYWGRGFAGECWRALTKLAFDELNLDLVEIGHEEGNERSKRAIEKYLEEVGGQYDGCLRNWTPVGDRTLDHHRYTVSQDEYGTETGG